MRAVYIDSDAFVLGLYSMVLLTISVYSVSPWIYSL